MRQIKYPVVPRKGVTKPPQKKRTLSAMLTDIRTWLVNGLVVLLVTIFSVYFVKQLDPNAIEIGHIGLPEDLVKAGYTPEVVSNIVRDNIVSINAVAVTEVEKMDVKPAMIGGDIRVSVLNQHIPLETVRRILQSVFNIHPAEITGEVVMLPHDSIQLTFRTRFETRTVKGPETDFNKLLSKSVEQIYGVIDPYMLAVYLRERKEVFASLDIVKSIISKPPASDDKWAWNLWGNLLMDEQLFSDSREKFEKAIAIDSLFHLPYHNLSIACEKDSLEEAIYYARHAVRLNDHSDKAHMQLGRLLAINQEFDAAKESLANAFEINPEAPDYYYYQSMLAMYVKDSLKSREYIQKALSMNNQNPDYYEWAGLISLGSHDYDEALRSFSKAFHLDKEVTAGKVRNGKYMLQCYDSLGQDSKRLKHMVDSVQRVYTTNVFVSIFAKRNYLTDF